MPLDNASDPDTCNLPHFDEHCTPPFAINGFARMGKCPIAEVINIYNNNNNNIDLLNYIY